MTDHSADHPDKSYPNYDDFLCPHCQKILETAIKRHEDLSRLHASGEAGITQDQVTAAAIRIAEVLDSLVILYGFLSVQRGSLENRYDLPRYFRDQREEEQNNEETPIYPEPHHGQPQP